MEWWMTSWISKSDSSEEVCSARFSSRASWLAEACLPHPVRVLKNGHCLIVPPVADVLGFLVMLVLVYRCLLVSFAVRVSSWSCRIRLSWLAEACSPSPVRVLKNGHCLIVLPVADVLGFLVLLVLVYRCLLVSFAVRVSSWSCRMRLSWLAEACL